jgi:uncharacterized membrane protein
MKEFLKFFKGAGAFLLFFLDLVLFGLLILAILFYFYYSNV